MPQPAYAIASTFYFLKNLGTSTSIYFYILLNIILEMIVW